MTIHFRPWSSTPAELVQLAQDWRGHLPIGGMMAETKIDGFRGAHFPGLDGKPHLWTRNGFAIEGTEHISAVLADLEQRAGEALMFDGEFQVDGTLAATKAWCERGWKLGGTAGVYHLFDAMPLADWQRGGCDVPLWQRKKRLVDLCGGLSGDCPVRLVGDTWLADAGEVEAEVKRVWAAGGEGLMLKDAEAPYRRCRSDAWLKVKRENLAKWRMAA